MPVPTHYRFSYGDACANQPRYIYQTARLRVTEHTPWEVPGLMVCVAEALFHCSPCSKIVCIPSGQLQIWLN